MTSSPAVDSAFQTGQAAVRACGERAGTGRCRLVVVDDHVVTRSGFVELFSSHAEFEVVGEAGDVRAAETLIASVRPDLVVLDLRLGTEQGLDLLSALTRATTGPRVLVVSMLEELVFGRVAFELGARGYVTKRADARDVVAAAGAVWRGALAVPKRLQADFVGTAGVGPDRVAGQKRPELASGARKLLSALATGEPLERLADSLGVSLATLYTQLYRIRKRLGFETLAQLRTYAKLHADYVAKRESPGMPDPSSARGITG